MCGRYNIRSLPSRFAEIFEAQVLFEFGVHYNVAPTQTVPVIRTRPHETTREIVPMRWGLIPSWAQDEKIGNRMINARCETVREKPAFRAAFKRRRCLVLADGFYEWKKTGKAKQPYHFHLRDNQLFAFAGLWERWTKGGEPIESCTIITTTANELVSDVHDRMPVILSPQAAHQWLNPDSDESTLPETLLLPYPAPQMDAEPVSTLVNSPKNDSVECLEVVEPD